MRPSSIIWFERLFLASLIVSLVNFVLGYGQMRRLWLADPRLAQVGLGSGFLVGAAVLSFVIYLLLWFLIARKASNVAKWVLVVFIAIGLLSLPSAFTGPFSVAQGLGLLVYILEIAAIVCLFRADARAWFAGEQTHEASPLD